VKITGKKKVSNACLSFVAVFPTYFCFICSWLQPYPSLGKEEKRMQQAPFPPVSCIGACGGPEPGQGIKKLKEENGKKVVVQMGDMNLKRRGSKKVM